MRIGQLAQRAGVNVETLRYYERRGLLAEPPRGPNGHRRYDEETVRFVRAVKEVQGLGFTLAEIEEYLGLSRLGPGRASDELRVRLAAKIDEVDGKLITLHRVREDLARVLGCACDSLDHCTCGAGYLEPEPKPGETLHVTNGGSTAGTLRATSLGGSALSWNDVLNEGPVPAVPAAELRAVRARFLSECGWGGVRAILHALERRDRLFELALGEGRHVVLWFEHDLYDQLQLLQALARADEAGFEAERLELVNVGSFEGLPRFRGLGELSPPELESLWSVRRPVSPEQARIAALGWAAVRAPAPTAMEEFVEGDTSALPFLGAALRRLLEQLPDTRSGLSRSERQLLDLLAEGTRTPVQLFVESQEREEAPFDGDTWVWRRLAELGRAEHPLVALEEGRPVPAPPPVGDARTFAAARLALTDAGRDVLEERADRIDLLGIDRWLGGTHLRPDNAWRWDPVSRCCVAPR